MISLLGAILGASAILFQPSDGELPPMVRLPATPPTVQIALMPFAPAELRVTLVDDQHGRRCAIEIYGEPYPALVEAVCPRLSRATPNELAGEANAGMNVLRFFPAGTEALPTPAVRGIVVGSMIIELEIDQSGRITACRDQSRSGLAGQDPTLCTGRNMSGPVFQPSANQEIRRGRVELNAYLLGAPGS